MNIERIPEHLTKWLVILGGIVLALILGQQIGNGKFGTIALILLLMGIAGLALAIPGRIWMAIPMSWPLVGQIPALGIPAAVKDLFTVAVFGVFLVLIAFKIIRRKPEVTKLDVLVGITVFYLIVSFVRNPVGVAASDESARIGGRPYFNVLIGFLAYWVLSRSALPTKNTKSFPVAYTGFRAIEGVAAQLLVWAPSLAMFASMYYVSPVFSWAMDPNAAPSEPGAESTQRLGYLASAGLPLATYIFTIYRPLSCINPLHIGRFAVFVVAMFCLLASGFRSLLALVGACAVLSSYLHRGKAELWRIAAMGIVCVIFLAVGQGTVFNLPRSAQRALSFLPGNWDQLSLDEGKESTRWRVEMWQQMLGSNKYIDSHLLGDGFGFKRVDLERITAKRALGINADQEDFMTTGGVHSGPISAIRYVGYLGLLIHLLLFVGLIRLAWQLIKRATGTSWQALVYLVGIPIIVEPFFFTFIFGAYEVSVPDAFFAVGMLHMLKNSMDEAGVNVPSVEMSLPSIEEANDKSKAWTAIR